MFGIVQNMSGFSCPKCGHMTDIFGQKGAVKMAEEMELELLGDVPLHPSICQTSDGGTPVVVSQPDSPQVWLKSYSRVYILLLHTSPAHCTFSYDV